MAMKPSPTPRPKLPASSMPRPSATVAPVRKPFVPALKDGVRPAAPTDAEKKAQYDYKMKSDARKAALMKGIKRK